ncbi:hypothetical protein BT96DRAFT_1009042 [Gymnopus androsaceus JB14]|uniref:Uncharacterized protein n=1 Tax=Gymnopus androsaceus JB14 TaxID=1447944 RepID=A0A6A4GDM7_9AGAR|nr:hypothetical protein BT96DRAFT_1009042 [Gymnopus androsaceus JB14]
MSLSQITPLHRLAIESPSDLVQYGDSTLSLVPGNAQETRYRSDAKAIGSRGYYSNHGEIKSREVCEDSDLYSSTGTFEALNGGTLNGGTCRFLIFKTSSSYPDPSTSSMMLNSHQFFSYGDSTQPSNPTSSAICSCCPRQSNIINFSYGSLTWRSYSSIRKLSSAQHPPHTDLLWRSVCHSTATSLRHSMSVTRRRVGPAELFPLRTTFVGGVAVGGTAMIPFGQTTPLNPAGSCPANPTGLIANGVQLYQSWSGSSGAAPPAASSSVATAPAPSSATAADNSAATSSSSTSTSGFALSNGQQAQASNAQFATLTTSSSCTSGQDACVNGGFAQCVNGSKCRKVVHGKGSESTL